LAAAVTIGLVGFAGCVTPTPGGSSPTTTTTTVDETTTTVEETTTTVEETTTAVDETTTTVEETTTTVEETTTTTEATTTTLPERVQQLDQNNSGTVLGGIAITNTGSQYYAYSQTFTAGITGDLDQITLHIQGKLPTAAPLLIDIRAVSGGVPTSTVLGTTTYDGGTGFVDIPLDEPVPVEAGVQYAIHLRTSVTGTASTWSFAITGSTYTSGSLFSYSGTNPPRDDFLDLRFRTWVTA
jgi:hypothetical protein